MQRNLSHSMAEYIQTTRRMTYMVKAVDLTLESLYTGRALHRAIWRYEALWLPLLAALENPPNAQGEESVQISWRVPSFDTKVDEIRSKNFSKGGLWLRSADVVPPLDIAWIWHCHRLNPAAYAEDLARFVDEDDQDSIAYMRRACATSIETAFRFSDGEDVQSKPTRRLWSIVYPFEAFMPKYLLSHTYDDEESKQRQHITSYANEITRSSFRSILQYDLAMAAQLQKAFLYQIVNEENPDKGDLFEKNEYLIRGYQRYLQFIVLHQHAPDTFLVPMNDINIIWHMHLSCTAEYEEDCRVLIGRQVPHDTLDVERIRKEAVEQMERERAEHGDLGHEESMEEEELEELDEKRRRGIAVKETKALWESMYGTKPRYDLPDTRYRGQPPGERGGFYQIFERSNGTTKDITWSETVLRMILAIIVFCAGLVVLSWAFFKTMVTHGKYLLGLPAGVGVMAFGLHIFLAIPISRPLSSQSRYWLERSYRETHNPLPPYLISSERKCL